MGKLRVMALAGAAAMMTVPAAQAADMPPVYYKPAPIKEEFAGGWYLRGDIGMSNQNVRGLSHPLFDFVQQNGNTLDWPDRGGFSSAPFFAVGLGYQFGSWIRLDVTGEYRGKADFKALDRVFDPAGALIGVNRYEGKKSEWVVMANAYFDLGTWYGFTPFVGAGAGVARNTISHFFDYNPLAGGSGYAGEGHKWNFAWAVHAGMAYNVTPNVTIELAYRYLNVGDAQTGEFRNSDPALACAAVPCQPMNFRNIDSHDVKLGVRWLLNPPAPVFVPPPVMTRG
jgi:opacity protein-like surface antigen